MFSNVLIGIDGRQGGRDAIQVARRLAEPGARFTLVNVYGAGLMPGRGAALLLAEELRLAEVTLERERDESGIAAAIEPCADHSVGRGLKRRAASLGADLIVVGSSRHRGFARFALGDDTASALDGAPCAVAVASPGSAESTRPLRRIGVGLDHGPESLAALARARELAQRTGATVSALGVVPVQRGPFGEPLPTEGDDLAEHVAAAERARLAALDGVDWTAVACGCPDLELERLSHDFDLLVVGSRSQGPVARLLHGSTSSHLASRCACPLLILPRSATTADPHPPASHPPLPLGV